MNLGQYELHELIGVGGMGSVYRARQASLHRQVAVKVLSDTLAENTVYLARFNREAQTAAALHHPNIITIYDFGIQQHTSYVVMEFLTGGSLAQRLQAAEQGEHPLPSPGEVAELLRQIGSALDYAHNEGVIHRDVKPSNIMFDQSGRALLVDFGIAKLTEATTSLTLTGMSVGSPSYMPPEQWRGEDLAAAADQYALAMVAYVLLTGRLPFEGSTPYALMHKHINEMPTAVHILRPEMPQALTQALERALAKDPAARYPSCTAFAQAFAAALEGKEGQPTGFYTFKLRQTSTGNRPHPLQMPSRSSRLRPGPPFYQRPLVIGAALLAITLSIALGMLLAAGGGESPALDLTATVIALAQTMITEAVTNLPSATATPPVIVTIPSEIPTEVSPTQNTPTPMPSEPNTLTPPPSETWPPPHTLTVTASNTPAPTATLTATLTSTAPPTPTPIPSLTTHPLTEIAQHLTEAVGTATAYASAQASTPTPTAGITPYLTMPYQAFETLVASADSPTARDSALQRAYTFQGGNLDWEPYTETLTFDNGLSLDLALVPVGCFRMGNDPETSDGLIDGIVDGGEQCFAEPFWIGHYEVTNAQYHQCMDAGACTDPVSYGPTFEGTDQPVVGVSWFQARQFTVWLSEISGLPFNLPTEAEWEYVARGPDANIYAWDNTTWPSCRLSNSYGCIGYPSEGGSLSPASDSWVGVADIAGNVWEWTSSIHLDYPFSILDGRQELASQSAERAIRGGGWDDDPSNAHAATRLGNHPEFTRWNLGLRVAGDFSVIGNCCNTAAQATATANPSAADPAAVPTELPSMLHIGASVGMRAEAGGEIIRWIAAGDYPLLTASQAQGEVYFQIQEGDQMGWIRATRWVTLPADQPDEPGVANEQSPSLRISASVGLRDTVDGKLTRFIPAAVYPIVGVEAFAGETYYQILVDNHLGWIRDNAFVEVIGNLGNVHVADVTQNSTLIVHASVGMRGELGGSITAWVESGTYPILESRVVDGEVYYQVLTANGTGWIRATTWVEVLGNTETTPDPEDSANPSLRIGSSVGIWDAVGGDILRFIPAGTYPILARSEFGEDVYYQVRIENLSGWIRANQFVEVAGNLESVPLIAADLNAVLHVQASVGMREIVGGEISRWVSAGTYPVLAWSEFDGETHYSIRTSGAEGWIRAMDSVRLEGTLAAVPFVETDILPLAIVTVDSANLRSGPGTYYAVIATVDRGTLLKLLARSDNVQALWYLVRRSNGQTAWVWSALVHVTPPDAELSPASVAD